MAKFYYAQTVVYTLEVEADTLEEADDIAGNTDIHADGVMADYSGWQEDGML